MSWSYTPFWVLEVGEKQDKVREGKMTIKEYKEWVKASNSIPDHVKEDLSNVKIY